MQRASTSAQIQANDSQAGGSQTLERHQILDTRTRRAARDGRLALRIRIEEITGRKENRQPKVARRTRRPERENRDKNTRLELSRGQYWALTAPPSSELFKLELVLAPTDDIRTKLARARRATLRREAQDDDLALGE